MCPSHGVETVPGMEAEVFDRVLIGRPFMEVWPDGKPPEPKALARFLARCDFLIGF